MKIKLFALFCLPYILFSQLENRVEVKSTINHVKLYLTAGEINRRVQLDLEAGRNRVVFKGISAYADPQSIQFATNNTINIVSTSTEMDFFAGETFNPRIVLLTDSLKQLKQTNKYLHNDISALDAERMLLETNYKLGGNTEKLTVEELRKAADFIGKKMKEIGDKHVDFQSKIIQNKLVIGKIKNELAQLNFKENERSNQIVLLIDSPKKQRVQANLVYMVSDCGWAATYDLSASNLTDPISLTYKAQVYNNTGNDWEKVNLTLTTGDPNLSASHPQMRTWFLNESMARLDGLGVKNELRYNENEDYRAQAQSNIAQMNQRVYEEVVLDKEGVKNNGFINNGSFNYYSDNASLPNLQINQKPAVETKTIEISQLSSEFVIDMPFSVPADAKPYTVKVKDVTLNASFSHIAVPKMDKGAFLLAKVTGWQDLDLIPGPTNVYFGGNYVGISEIHTRNVNDTLSLSFGRDNKVLVTRELKKEFTQKSTVGNNRKDTYTFEITVRNNREQTTYINIFDQIPVSRNGDISVSVGTISNGSLTEENGEVEWNLSVAPNEVKTMQISFTVKYPKDYNFTVKRYRAVQSARF